MYIKHIKEEKTIEKIIRNNVYLKEITEKRGYKLFEREKNVSLKKRSCSIKQHIVCFVDQLGVSITVLVILQRDLQWL